MRGAAAAQATDGNQAQWVAALGHQPGFNARPRAHPVELHAMRFEIIGDGQAWHHVPTRATRYDHDASVQRRTPAAAGRTGCRRAS